ncbi:hypothetical protein CYY_008128 [Polysphondylium violaceum]|uniref:EGF-like domain-containing protein n=1 Tax=Polysphondylium violaceum TaxID=133409 RepID=A0A8J4PNS2_9MYCE|nr:hypothetical protein CYY_008128 [Polysphondylium violaceum]
MKQINILVAQVILLLLVVPLVSSLNGVSKPIPNRVYDFYADVNGNCSFEYYIYIYEIYGDAALFTANYLQKTYVTTIKDSGMTITVNTKFTCSVMPIPIINSYGFRDLKRLKTPYEYYFKIENKAKDILGPLAFSLSSNLWYMDSNHHFVDRKTYVVYLYPPMITANLTFDMKITFPDGKVKTLPVNAVYDSESFQHSITHYPNADTTSNMFTIAFNMIGNSPIFIKGQNDPPKENLLMNRPVYGSLRNSTSRAVFLWKPNNPIFHFDAYWKGEYSLATIDFKLQAPTLPSSVISFEGTEEIIFEGFNPLVSNFSFRNNYYSVQLYNEILYEVGAGNLRNSFTPSSPYYLQDGAYGIVDGKIYSHTININLISSQYFTNSQIRVYFFSTLRICQVSPSLVDLSKPSLVGLQVIYLPLGFNRYFIVRAQINDDISGFRMMSYQTKYGPNVPFMSSKDLVEGNLLQGAYEIVYNEPSFYASYIYIEDYASNTDAFGIELGITNETKLIKLSNPDQFNTNIQNLEFTYANWSHNDIDVGLVAYSTNFTFNVTNAYKFACPVMTLIHYDNYPTTNYYGLWSETLQLFEIVVTVPLRTFTGVVDFTLNYGGIQTNSTFLNTMFPSSELRVFSEDADMFGPEIQNLVQIPGPTATVMVGGGDISIGWDLVISDRLNGVKSGNITIISEGDLTEYNFLVSDNPVVSLRIPIKEKCFSQTFSFKSVYFIDKGGYVSNMTNMFINYVDYKFQRIVVTCPPSTDISSPVLTNFTIPTVHRQVNVGAYDRTVTFSFIIEDNGDGVKIDKRPYLYLTSTNEIVKTQVLANPKIMGNQYIYNGEIQLPYGFGYPNKILISLYGLVDNAGNFAGFTSLDLDRGGFPFSLDTTFSTENPVIESTSDITTAGGKLLIMGKAFGRNITNVSVIIRYDDNVATQFTPSFCSNTVLIIDNVKPPTQRTFAIRVKKGTIVSVAFDVTPKPAIVYPGSYSSSSSFDSTSPSSQETPSSSSSSKETPTPTKPVHTCSSNCGSPSQGYCSPTGCICYSPWIGIDCKSKTIIIPTPSFNNTIPSTNVSVPTDNSEKSILTGLISIVELQELDTSNQLVYKYPFTQWIWSNISRESESIKYLYSTNITNQLDQSITNISVSIQYFDKEENITFAGELLNMNPYSIKYSINITSYTFTHSLNHLQLIMKVVLESQQDQGCSAFESGNTTVSNSEYVKLQLDNHSLYGRFIKRGVIDGRIASVTNQVLPNYNNNNGESNQFNNIQSYISIGIRSYSRLVQLDPDFSVLLDQSPAASDSDNSVCSSKPKSKLSGAQIAGIVIGAIALTAIVTISVVYYLYKKKKAMRFNKNVVNKLKNMN